MPKIEVDSRGKGGERGSCGYYAFTTSLIWLLQGELSKRTQFSPESPLVTKFLNLVPESEQKECLEIIRKFNVFTSPYHPLIEKINGWLRKYLVDTALKSLNDKFINLMQDYDQYYQQMLSEQVAVDILTIFWGYFNNQIISDFMPELFSNVKVREAIKTTALRFHKMYQREKSEDISGMPRTFIVNKADVSLTKNGMQILFTNLCQTKGRDHQLSDDSIIAEAIRNKLKETTFATHDDLNELAKYFDICLITYTDGQATSVPKGDDRLKIHLDNKRNVHWTALIEPALTSEELSAELEKYSKLHLHSSAVMGMMFISRIKAKLPAPLGMEPVIKFIEDQRPKSSQVSPEFEALMSYILYRSKGVTPTVRQEVEQESHIGKAMQ